MLLNQFKAGSGAALMGAPNAKGALSSLATRSRVGRATPARPRGGRDQVPAQARSSGEAGEGWISTITNKVGSFVGNIINHKDEHELVQYKATIVISKKLLKLDLVDRVADVKDDASEVLGQRVTVQLVSTQTDPKTGKAMLSHEAAIEHWINTLDLLTSSDFTFRLAFAVPKGFGVPGAVIVRNQHPNEFLLVSFSIALPDAAVAHYTADSWVYNTNLNKEGRIFFRNKVYLPSDTPAGLKELREKELRNLRGDGTGKRVLQDRIYDYEVYNDLGQPDVDPKLARPHLGGPEFPYPRRCRTGRPPSKASPTCESQVPDGEDIYIPRDEYFNRVKASEFKAGGYKSKAHAISTKIKTHFTKINEFESIEAIKQLYAPKEHDLGGLNNVLPDMVDIPKHEQQPLAFLNELLGSNGQPNNAVLYPIPKIIKVDDNAWQSDDEFAREFLAGLNPVVIKLVTEFPIKSKLDSRIYGDPTSAIAANHIESRLEGLSIKQALAQKKLFVADYHDTFYPFLEKINEQKDSAAYASRALFFLTGEKTLKVLAIELVLPPKTPGGPKRSRVFTPPTNSKDWVWELAKAHVQNNDIFGHQVFSHFTRCHAVAEPYLIATNRQLSVLHPVHQLLEPHYRYTMETNRTARARLISAGGIIETVFTPRAYSMRMSAIDYKNNWTFDGQALPNDLIKRGMAVPDSSAKYGVKLVVDDYPFALDGIVLWDAIKSWNTDYVDVYYKDDRAVQNDVELQRWWTEIRTMGHADKKDSPGWPEANSKMNLAQILTTIQWVTSCQHAAVNFGQYHYGGFMPHHPTSARRFIPEVGTKEWEEFQQHPEKYYLLSLSDATVTTTTMSVYEVLSTHASEEEYIGTRNDPNWTENEKVKTAFKNFASRINDIDQLIKARNANKSFKNRTGPSQYPYELLRPASKPGMTGMGIPNSITI